MSILRRQLVWGLPAQGHQVIHFFPLVEVSASMKQLGNVHQGGATGGVLGRSLSREGPVESAQLQKEL